MGSAYRYIYRAHTGANFSTARFYWTDPAEKEKDRPTRSVLRQKRNSYPKDELPSIHCLPEEVMLEIFRLLDIVDLARSVIPVCSRWYRLGRDESLWSRAALRFDPTSQSAGGFIRTVMTAPVIGSVEYISDEKNIQEDIAKSLTLGCSRILSLTLLPWYLTHIMLRKILEHLAVNLRHLEICIPDLGVLSILEYMYNLRSLILHGEISYVSDMLLKLGSGCPQLQILDLGALRFNDVHRLDIYMEQVVRGHADHLTELKLPPNLTSSRVLDAVALCQKLKVLAIWITPYITSPALTKALENLSLESLTWRNYDGWLDSAELAHFILYSNKFTILKEFRLVDCIDMDDGLATALSYRCQNLSTLSLHRSDLSSEGLLKILTSAHNLKYLDVYKNSSFNISHLEIISEHLRQLQFLDIRRCYAMRGIKTEVWDKILDDLPQLQIRFD